MKDTYITITGLSHYLGAKPFKVGRIVRLRKEEQNEFDSDAICVELPYVDTIGYVANSPYTVYDGTACAGRLYDKIGDIAFAQVMFITHSSVIARVMSDEELKNAKNPVSDFFSVCEVPEDEEDEYDDDDCLRI